MKNLKSRIILFTGIIFFILTALFVYSRSWKHALFITPLFQINTSEKILALTFDDGPSAERTERLLDLLKKHDVKATFFMLGMNIKKHPETAKKVIEQGHLAGNHSFSHPRIYLCAPWTVYKEIKETEILIQKSGQQDVHFFRPPYSAKFIVLPLFLKFMKKTLVTGSFDPPAEYQNPCNPDLIANQVICALHPGSIVYLHDGRESDTEGFLKSVEQIIIRAKNSGYSFVTLEYARN